MEMPGWAVLLSMMTRMSSSFVDGDGMDDEVSTCATSDVAISKGVVVVGIIEEGVVEPGVTTYADTDQSDRFILQQLDD